MANDPASVRRKLTRDDEAFDVPAAVLCAFCGQPDCAGCAAATEEGSGVVAIVPWERGAGGAWARLWATATATTQGAETFFAVLPDGALPPAMRFAVLAETLAVVSMLAALLPLAALALPQLTLQLAQDPGARASALPWITLGVPALIGWMVIAHAAHGAALDLGARRQGARPQRRRALRFGLYACGWDLMAGPLGAVVTLISSGRKGMAELLALSMRAPGRSSTALLQGVYALPPPSAARARRAGGIAAVALTIASGFAVVALILVLG
jgi:hypothetical protein